MVFVFTIHDKVECTSALCCYRIKLNVEDLN